ncbi:ABC transporter ATP-binding protein [Nesterenkonia aerolata]|uniref:ATP-binding cassette domain-containing protein n=1 Tax=Nesterenkonia aerolata TaxID=3074079 RepID=A0ABU2DTV1_9MICC|nr:oligopeptide/dipeptide ABC transporter ATP-binding protein [Nesterenkonia sp. LY-0111]MDR8019811.1 ATP-binding cassette domain-containing protein [Nesterenkonia sp. LY-0111]
MDETSVRPTGRTDQSADGGVEPLLSLRGLSRHFVTRSGVFRRRTTTLRAVDGVDLDLRPGETLGLVGESGCGKSTLGRCVLRIDEPTAGEIRYRGRRGAGYADADFDAGFDADVDVARAAGRELAGYRRDVRLVFQDPFGSLNPRMTVRQLLGESMRSLPSEERTERTIDLLRQVGLRRDHLDRYPHAFSGGERQRIGIARAIATDPQLVVADEAVSALDVSVRAQVLNLFGRLQAERGLAYLFISHDLSVVEHLSDRVAVMYLGQVIEIADKDTLFTRPGHPYTEALLSAVPQPDPRVQRFRERITVRGELPDPTAVPSGCPFRTRCLYAETVCAEQRPPLRMLPDGQQVACHFAGELSLRGVERLG